jgi:hypothetical protein
MNNLERQMLRAMISTALVCPSITLHAAVIEGFVGQSSTQVAAGVSVKLLDANSGKVMNIDETNFFGKYKFKDVEPGHYLLQVEDIKRELLIKNPTEKKRLDIDLSAKGGVMDYSKSGAEAAPASKSDMPTSPATSGADNANLRQRLAGSWWGYSGSTERRISLCPDGSYGDFREAGYSGRQYDSGGYQTGAWGAASGRSGQGSWSIQGDEQRGIIHVRYNDGRASQLNYNRTKDGCLNINGNTLCRESPNCR